MAGWTGSCSFVAVSSFSRCELSRCACLQGPTNYLRDPMSTWERLTFGNTFCESRALAVPQHRKLGCILCEKGSDNMLYYIEVFVYNKSMVLILSNVQ